LDMVLGTAIVQGSARRCGWNWRWMCLFHRMRVDEGVELDAYTRTTMIGGLLEHGYAYWLRVVQCTRT
jgi:hypothetical protein